MSLKKLLNQILNKNIPTKINYEQEKEESFQYLQDRGNKYETLLQHKIPDYESLALSIDLVHKKDVNYRKQKTDLLLVKGHSKPIAFCVPENFNYNYNKELTAIVTLYKECINNAVNVVVDFLDDQRPLKEENEQIKKEYSNIFRNNYGFYDSVETVSKAMNFQSNKEFPARSIFLDKNISETLRVANEINKYYSLKEECNAK